MAAQYFPQGVLVTPTGINMKGEIIHATFRPPTLFEIMATATADIVYRMIQTTVDYEKQFMQTAISGVAPINATSVTERAVEIKWG